MSRTRILVALVSVGSALPPAAVTQVPEVALYAGRYLPMGDIVSGSGGGYYVSQQASAAWGARVTVWLSRRVRIEGTLGYAPSSVDPGATSSCCNSAHVITASAKVVAPVIVDGFQHFRVGGGLGLVAHGGRAYQDVDGATSVAVIVGAGLVFALGRTPFTLRLDAEDYSFNPHFSAGSSCLTDNPYGGHVGICGLLTRGPYTNRFQNDVILSAGVAVAAGAH